MKVCIVGWYGTETIGDRGILAGIFSFFHQTFNSNFSISIGSLCPYFSERTILEDSPFYKKILSYDIPISLFDSRVVRELEEAVAKCDLLVVGGGPIMHINALFMIEYAFKLAKKKGKKTMLLGCGIGPLSKKKHQKSTILVAENCDKIILRDNTSANRLRELYQLFNVKFDESKVHSSFDPSVQCLLDYQDNRKSQDTFREDYVALNMRFFPQLYGNEKSASKIDSALYEILQIVSERFSEKKIRLIPMGYFHLAHDDRDFLNTLKIKLNKNNVEVQNVPLTLEETMQVFQDAWLNIGMRFHSVVFQTILNGRNFILDYTEPQKGKISGFLNDMDGNSFYKERYFNLQTLSNSQDVQLGLDNIDLSQKFSFDIDSVKKKLEVYATTLKSLA